MNPLVPTSSDAILALVALASVALAVFALVSLGRSRTVSGVQALAWAAVILLVPALGAVGWFVVGKRIRQPA